MVGWHHRLNGHGFGWTLGVGEGQRGLACCGSWGYKELDTTEQLNELISNFVRKGYPLKGVVPGQQQPWVSSITTDILVMLIKKKIFHPFM